MNCEHLTTRHSIKCYDNGGRTVDRYAVLYLDHRKNNTRSRGGSLSGPCCGVTMSANPFHPQGFGQHGCDFMRGSHLGKVIRFKDLPKDCQQLVLSDLNGRWVRSIPVHVRGGVAYCSDPLVRIHDHD